jgi:3-deoxy-D-manno-octulosonic-acid transferase
MYLLYSALLAVVLALGLPYWLVKMLRHGKYRAGLGQRLGRVPAGLRKKTDSRQVIWVHAVSLGEVLAVQRVVDELRRRHPDIHVVVSTTTRTGQLLARERFGEDEAFYFPLDFAFAVRPYLQALRPRLVVLAETEFWPNFLRMARQSGASVAVVNGRISDRSLPGYRRFRWLFERILRNVDLFLVQTAQDQERLVEIGAIAERVRVSGNVKFDIALPTPPSIVTALRSAFERGADGPVLVCGSIMDDEDRMLIRMFENVLVSHPRAVMLMAPRHPERFDRVAELLKKLNVRHWRRSLWSGEDLSGAVLLIDTIGELAWLYSLADVAFVGGSLVPRGGHNILEPAQHGVAIVIGNHHENFRDIVWQFRQADAVRVVGPAELPLVFMELISNPAERARLGRNALATLQTQKGATERTVAALEELLARTPATGGASTKDLRAAGLR